MKISTEIWSTANHVGEEKAVELVAKADFDAKIAEYAAELKKAPLAAALAKKIEKARLAIIKYAEKMRAKGKEIDGNKVAKLAMGGSTIYCTPVFEPDLEVTSAYDVVKVATEGTKQDFTELYYISEAKHKLYFENRTNGENYFFSVRYNENFNEYVNNLKLGNVKAVVFGCTANGNLYLG